MLPLPFFTVWVMFSEWWASVIVSAKSSTLCHFGQNKITFMHMFAESPTYLLAASALWSVQALAVLWTASPIWAMELSSSLELLYYWPLGCFCHHNFCSPTCKVTIVQIWDIVVLFLFFYNQNSTDTFSELSSTILISPTHQYYGLFYVASQSQRTLFKVQFLTLPNAERFKGINTYARYCIW